MLDLVFPSRCLGCGRAGRVLCAACEPSVAVVSGPICARCGRPWEEPVATCAECPPREVDAARAPFLYAGPIAAAIKGLKFRGWSRLARHLAGAMAEVWDLEADVVTWVPLARRRRAQRGFDQAEVLARALAPRIGLPVRPLLRRVRDTPQQAKQGPAERRRALSGAFAARRHGGTVLLVDDVLTTGATAAACARASKEAGTDRVVVLTAARAIRSPAPTHARLP